MDPAFWANQERARTVVQEIKQLKSWVTPFADLTARLADAPTWPNCSRPSPTRRWRRELEAEVDRLEAAVDRARGARRCCRGRTTRATPS